MNLKKSFRIFILSSPFYFQKEKIIEIVKTNPKLMILLIIICTFSLIFLLFGTFRSKLSIYQIIFLMFFTALLFQRVQFLKKELVGNIEKDANKDKFRNKYQSISQRVYNYFNSKLKNDQFKNDQFKNDQFKNDQFKNDQFNHDIDVDDTKETSSTSNELTATHFLQKMKIKLLDLKEANIKYNSFLNYQSKIRNDLMNLFEKFKSEFLMYREDVRIIEQKFVDRDIVLDLYVNSLSDLEKSLKSQFILQNLFVKNNFRKPKKGKLGVQDDLNNLKFLEVYLILEGLFSVIALIIYIYDIRAGMNFLIQLFMVMNFIWSIIILFYAHSLHKSIIELDIPECNSKLTDLHEIKLYLSNDEEINGIKNSEKSKNKKALFTIFGNKDVVEIKNNVEGINDGNDKDKNHKDKNDNKKDKDKNDNNNDNKDKRDNDKEPNIKIDNIQNDNNQNEIKFIENRIKQILKLTDEKIKFIETFLKNLTMNPISKKIAIFEDLLKKSKYLEDDNDNQRIEEMRNIIDKLKYKIENLDISKILSVFKNYVAINDFFKNEIDELRFVVNRKNNGFSLCSIGIKRIKRCVDVYDEIYFLLFFGSLVMGILGCMG
ncbi:hypothetical protein DMUE_4384 [Dictyocoela muelleri]|nr:hypothetical protein DMUE_4384 [Dictyocoela muelleri]